MNLNKVLGQKPLVSRPAAGLSHPLTGATPQRAAPPKGLGASLAAGSSGTPSWMLTGTAVQDEVARSADFGERAPEFRVPADESRKFIFRAENALAAFHVYKLRINGKWQTITVPPEGEDLLITNIPDIRPSLLVLWEGVDVDGFKSKKTGKTIGKNRLSVFPCSSKTSQVIEAQKEDFTLTGKVIKIRRIGLKQPTYTLTVLPESPTADALKALKQDSLMAKLTDWYAPPNEKEQLRLIRLYRAEPSQGDDE